jgi:preprotein translocase subunit SecD
VTRRSLLTPLIFTVLLAIISLGATVVTDTQPTLGLDLQGGFSVVLQAKEVNGRLPSEESVEKAKDIIRQRVDGLGVAEPDITRQGRTVIVQLPGVKNREKAEALVGCTARLEFRPVQAFAPNPDAVSVSTDAEGETTTTEAGDASTTTVAGDDASTTTAPADGSTTTAPAEPTTTEAGAGTDEQGLVASGEDGTGMVGIGSGEGALPVQFAPTTTTTTLPPTTTTLPPATTTTTAPATSTTVAGDPSTTTTAVPGTAGGTSSSCGDGATGGPETTTTTAVPGAPAAGGQFPSEDGQLVYTLGEVGFTGDALSRANAALQNEWTVNVAVKGSQKADANAAFNECYQGGPTCPAQNQEGRGAIAIVLDGEVLSAPAVNGPDLAADQFTISGGFTEGEAKDLALVLRYGSLPVEFEQAALQQVSATLGADSLRAGLIAGLIGIAGLALYMILYYRGFGMVVVISLVVWGALMYSLICALSANQGLALTLAGITGIIVSVGTTVDTYVVVFERVKDELRSGRSVRAATERGYQSGIKTVLTANGAAFIGAFLLWYLTVGPVRGFAYFLGLSVILDLFVAILFTRPLILLLARSPRFAKAKFFGIGSSTDQAVPSNAKVVAP